MMSLRNFGRTLPAVVFSLLLVACHDSDDSPAGGSNGGTVTPTPVDNAFLDLSSAELNQEIARFQSLDLTAQLNEISAKELPAERALLSWTGVEGELGGAAATDVALAAVANSVRDTGLIRLASLKALPQLSQASSRNVAGLIQALRAQAEQLSPAKRQSGIPTAQDATGQGANGFLGLGLTFIETGVASNLITSATNNGQVVEHQSSTTEGSNQGTTSLSASRDTIHYDSTTQGVHQGLDVKLKSAIDATPCPDVNGKVTVKIVSDGSITKAGGTTGANTKVMVEATGYYNDDAQLSDDFDYQMHVEQASYETSRGAFVDIDYSGQTGKSGSRRVNRTSSQATATHLDMADTLAQFALTMAFNALHDTEGAVASGRCVKLQPTTAGTQRSGIEPSTAFQIFASPRSQVDGSPVGGTVKATLSGGSSLNPANTKVAADATFAYTAPSEYEKSATVSLEARSKRGVAKAEVSFNTRKKEEETIQRYTGSASSNYQFLGDSASFNSSNVVWTLQTDSPGDQKLYMGSGTAVVEVINSGCTAARATMPVTGVMNVFDANRTDSWARGYIYSLYTQAPTIVTVQCSNGGSQEVSVFGSINVVGCDGDIPSDTNSNAPAELLRYTDSASLVGSRTVTCDGASDTVQWSFKADR